MRKYLRRIARENMEAVGITGGNKKHFDMKSGKKKSFFAVNWRKFATRKAFVKAQAARVNFKARAIARTTKKAERIEKALSGCRA